MDPVLMVGAWAGAFIATATAGKLLFNAFLKATRAAVSEEFERVWRELNDSDKWHQERFAKFEASLEDLRVQVARLEAMMQAHVQKEQ